jgi:hypothetical protein
MAENVFETVDPAHLSGKVSSFVIDPEDPNTPQTIIETDDHWEIQVDWSITGLIAPYIGGTWHVRAFLDDLDGGPFEGKVASADLALSTTGALPLPRKYSTRLKVAAGKVPAGVYRLMTVINYDNTGKRLEMAAFSEGPILEFYDKEGSA